MLPVLERHDAGGRFPVAGQASSKDFDHVEDQTEDDIRLNTTEHPSAQASNEDLDRADEDEDQTEDAIRLNNTEQPSVREDVVITDRPRRLPVDVTTELPRPISINKTTSSSISVLNVTEVTNSTVLERKKQIKVQYSLLLQKLAEDRRRMEEMAISACKFLPEIYDFFDEYSFIED